MEKIAKHMNQHVTQTENVATTVVNSGKETNSSKKQQSSKDTPKDTTDSPVQHKLVSIPVAIIK